MTHVLQNPAWRKDRVPIRLADIRSSYRGLNATHGSFEGARGKDPLLELAETTYISQRPLDVAPFPPLYDAFYCAQTLNSYSGSIGNDGIG